MERTEVAEQYSCLCMFPDVEHDYEATDIAEFLTELSRLYNVLLKFYKHHQEIFPEPRDMARPFDSLDEMLGHKDAAIAYLHQDMKRWVDYEFKDSKVWVRLEGRLQAFPAAREKSNFKELIPAYYPARLQYNRRESLKVCSINYNSPLKAELKGLAKPLIIAIAICGGEIEIGAVKFKMNGLAPTLVTLKDVFYPASIEEQILCRIAEVREQEIDSDTSSESEP